MLRNSFAVKSCKNVGNIGVKIFLACALPRGCVKYRSTCSVVGPYQTGSKWFNGPLIENTNVGLIDSKSVVPTLVICRDWTGAGHAWITNYQFSARGPVSCDKRHYMKSLWSRLYRVGTTGTSSRWVLWWASYSEFCVGGTMWSRVD